MTTPTITIEPGDLVREIQVAGFVAPIDANIVYRVTLVCYENEQFHIHATSVANPDSRIVARAYHFEKVSP